MRGNRVSRLNRTPGDHHTDGGDVHEGAADQQLLYGQKNQEAKEMH